MGFFRIRLGHSRGNEKTKIDETARRQTNITVLKNQPDTIPPAPEEVILVNAQNCAKGRGEKQAVHVNGQLHRAFSIFLVDARGQLLLQRRSLAKYHSGGLWANACCGHPRPGEYTLTAAHRRLHEELGATATLTCGFQTRYRTQLPDGLVENEFVYVYFGPTPATFTPNPAEVSEVTSMTLADLRADLRHRPQGYAYWLRHYLKNHAAEVKEIVASLVRSGR